MNTSVERSYMKKIVYILLQTLFCVTLFTQIPPVPPTGTGAAPLPGLEGLPPELMMSEEEFKQMVEFLETLDPKELEELEKLGRQVLTDMGINPDTLEPLPGQPTPPTPPEQPKAEEKKGTEPQIPVVSVQAKQEVERILSLALSQLMRVQEYLILQDKHEVAQLRQIIDDLTYYIKVLQHASLVERLALPAHQTIVSTTRQLADQLSAITLTQATISEEESENPYDILQVNPSATLEEITKVFEERAQELAPAKVKEELIQAGVPEKDAKRILKEAQLSLSLIKDAYELLSDPIARERIDEERKKKSEHVIEQQKFNQATLERIAQVCKTAVIDKNLISAIEKFLQDYEPEQLKIKKARDEAEKQRLKEQEALLRTRPTVTPGGPYERPGRRAPEFKPPVLPAFKPSEAGGKITPAEPGAAGVKEEAKKELPKKEDKKKPEKKDEKEKKEDKEKKEKPEKKKPESKKEEKKKDGKKEKTPVEHLKKLSSTGLEFANSLSKYESLIKQLPAFTHQPDTEAPPIQQENRFEDQLTQFIEESKIGELRSSLKEFNKHVKSKQLAGFRTEDIEAWNNFYKTYQPVSSQLYEIVKQSVAPENLNTTRAVPLLGNLENPGVLTTLYTDLEKIVKYFKNSNKPFEKKPEEKK